MGRSKLGLGCHMGGAIVMGPVLSMSKLCKWLMNEGSMSKLCKVIPHKRYSYKKKKHNKIFNPQFV